MIRTLTLGEQRVLVNFNPGNDPAVADFKQRVADLIDDVDGIPVANDQTARWKAEAMTQLEYGCGFAVKSLTAGQDETLDKPHDDGA